MRLKAAGIVHSTGLHLRLKLCVRNMSLLPVNMVEILSISPFSFQFGSVWVDTLSPRETCHRHGKLRALVTVIQVYLLC